MVRVSKSFLIDRSKKNDQTNNRIFCPHCEEITTVNMKKKFNQCNNCSKYIFTDYIAKIISAF